MIDKSAQDMAAFCDIVAINMKEFVEELRTIELVDLISFIRFESYATVEDLVSSSTELFFRPDRLTFSWAAGVDVRWDSLPSITLGLEFQHPSVSVFFNLTIRNADESVEILSLNFDRPRLDPRADLARAFAEARLPVGAAAAHVADSVGRGRRGMPWA